jgi:hypothetical protein
MLTISGKRNKIVPAISLRLALARPRADRPPPLLRSARPPGSLARLVCCALPPGSSARLLACGFPISCALFRRLINLAYCITLSLWHSAHFLGNGSCATTLYPTYPTYPTPCPRLFSSIVAKFILHNEICYYTPDGGGGSPSVLCGLVKPNNIPMSVLQPFRHENTVHILRFRTV